MTFSLIEVSKIEPNPWNPNMMGDREYQTLKEDMRVHGVEGVDPVLVSPKDIFYSKAFHTEIYVIVDGEHRWRAAGELKWEKIRCDVESIKEDEAKALCYRRNSERGTLDPFKEAVLFKTEQGTQAQIAQKYGVDPTTVSHRLSLLKLAPTVKTEVQSMPRGILSVSHLEPLTSLNEGDQVTVLKKIKDEAKWRGTAPPVKVVQENVERLKEQREAEKQLQEALKNSKYPKCPTCGKPPGAIHGKGLPWVLCESRDWDHSWNLNTGKLLFTPTPATAGEEKKERPLPQTLRSNYTVEEIHAAFVKTIKEIVPKMEIAEIRVSGMLDKAHFSFDLNKYSQAMSVSLEHGGKQHEGFRAEKHDYRSGEKTTVHCGSPQYIERTKRFIEKVFKGEMMLKDKGV